MATYYINAVSGTGNGTEGDPWGSFQEALAEAPIGTHTINVANGTYTSTYLYVSYTGTYNISGKDLTFIGESQDGVIIAASTYTIDLIGGACSSTGTLKFSNMTINQNNREVIRFEDYSDNYKIVLEDCIINHNPSDARNLVGTIYINGPTNPTRILEIKNCTINRNSYSSGIQMISCDSVEVSNCTITGGAGGSVFLFQNKVNTINIFGNDITGKNGDNGVYFIHATGLTANTNFIVYDNVAVNLVSGIKLYDYSDIVYIVNNNLTIQNTTVTDGGIILGHDDKDAVVEAFGSVVVQNNTVRFVGVGSHTFLIGAGVNNADCSHNTAIGGNYQYVIKGLSNHIYNNTAFGANCFSLYGSQYTSLHNNSAYATSGFAFKFCTNASDRDPLSNRIYNNIFDASGGGLYALDARETSGGNVTSTYYQLLNYNCYYGGASSVFRFNGSGYDTITELTTSEIWKDWVGHNLDSNSFVLSPQFKDVATGDFSLLSLSPCINAGKPTPYSGYTTIGAWQPQAIGVTTMISSAVGSPVTGGF